MSLSTEELGDLIRKTRVLQEQHLEKLYIEDPHYYSADSSKLWYEASEKHDYKVSMEYWWPIIKGLEGVNTPGTYLVPITPLDAWCIGGGDHPEHYTTACLNMQKILSIYLRSGQHYFLRGYFHSAKHERRVGAITSDTPFSVVMELIQQIFEACLIKDIPVAGLAIREFIKLESAFIAFNGMKISKEIRAVVKEDKIRLLPYWPENSIQFLSGIEEPPNWKLALKTLMHFPMDDKLEVVRQARILAEPLLKVHDFWTLDFAKGVDGKYYFIDAAVGETSWLGQEQDYEPYWI